MKKYLKNALSQLTEEDLNEFLTAQKENRGCYEMYYGACMSLRNAFREQMVIIVEKCCSTSASLKRIQCELKIVSAKKQLDGMKPKNILEGYEYLLHALKVNIIVNQGKKEEIKWMIESISDKRKEIDNDIANQPLWLIGKIIPSWFLGAQTRTNVKLSKLLSGLLQHMRSLHRLYEKLDSFITTKEIKVHDESVTIKSIRCAFKKSNKDDSSRVVLRGIDTLLYTLTKIESKANYLIKITPDF